MRRQVLFVGLICVAFLVNAQEEKTIDLDEVTIQASSIIRKRDRQLIFPSKDQVRRSMDGLDLTRRMSLPRLWVDPNTKSISMANGNVQFKSRKTKRDGCEKRNAFIETKTKCASNLIRKVTAYLQNQSKTPSLYIKINGIQMDF